MLARFFRHYKLVALGIWAGIVVASLAIPVYAIDDPLVLTINSVYAYQHCLEDDDQLYIVDYTVSYDDGNPATEDNPDENITEAYIVRLMNGAVELGSTAPYAYYDEGYGRGIASIYFTATEVTDLSITWEGAYTMELTGNPTLAWGGAIPSTSVGTFDLWSSSASQGATENELGARVLYFADLLELAWSVDLIESGATGSWLTSYGEDYFTNSIDSLQTLCPNIFSASLSSPVYPERDTHPPAYATTLRGAIVGTPLDLSAVAAIAGLPTIWFTTFIFIGIMAVAAFGIGKASGSMKPAVIVLASLVPVGVLIGWLDLVVAILMGFAAIVAVAYVFFFEKSST